MPGISQFFDELQRASKGVKWFFFLIALIIQLVDCYYLESRIKTQQQYRSLSINSQQLYSISLTRISSTNQSQNQSCHVNPKQIIVKKQKQIYRLFDSENPINNREKSIFQKITTLDDNPKIIQQFEFIGNSTFFLTTEAKGFFLQPQSQNAKEVKTMLNFTLPSQAKFFNILIKNFKERALIITPNQMSLCRIDRQNCILIEPYQPLPNLFSAEIYISDAITYIFLLTGDSVIVYEITAGNQLINKFQYGSRFFGVDKIHLMGIIKSKRQQFLLLDSTRGIFSVSFEEKLSKFKTQRLVYQQPGCYQFISKNLAQEIVLTCTLAPKSFFIQKIMRSETSSEEDFQIMQTIFTNQKIYDTAIAENFIMTRVYSGVKLYWTSGSLINPYPYDYNNAGSIFLHNSLESKFKLMNQEMSIYISTEDEIRQYSIKAIDPYVWCYALKDIIEIYKLVYSFPCANPTPMHSVCEFQEELNYKSWEHGEIKINTMLIPLVLSLIGLIIIGIVIAKIYQKYTQDIERIKLKHNTESQFAI